MPLPFIRNRRIPKEEISRLRINFPVVVQKDGDVPEVIRKTINSKKEISRLRLNFLVEVHGDGDALPFIRNRRIPMGGNLRAAYNFPCRGTWGRRRPFLYTQ